MAYEQADYSYSLVAASKDHPLRGVFFLVSEDRRITANLIFDELPVNVERHFRSRFDAWIDGLKNTHWYHGWDKLEFSGKYTRCFVFKCKEGNR